MCYWLHWLLTHSQGWDTRGNAKAGLWFFPGEEERANGHQQTEHDQYATERPIILRIAILILIICAGSIGCLWLTCCIIIRNNLHDVRR